MKKITDPGIGTINPDPDTGKSSGSMRIRIRKRWKNQLIFLEEHEVTYTSSPLTPRTNPAFLTVSLRLYLSIPVPCASHSHYQCQVSEVSVPAICVVLYLLQSAQCAWRCASPPSRLCSVLRVILSARLAPTIPS